MYYLAGILMMTYFVKQERNIKRRQSLQALNWVLISIFVLYNVGYVTGKFVYLLEH